MTPAKLRWGLIFIQVGILILLRNFEVLNDNFWFEMAVLSPVVLIAVGVEKIFTKTKLQFISYLTSIALFIGGFSIAFLAGAGGMDENFFSETTYIKDFDPSIKKLSAELRFNNTDLTIRDSGSDLIYGKFDEFTRKPEINYEIQDDQAKISLISRKHNYLAGAVKIDLDEPQDWYLRFSEDIPIDLECYGDENDIHLNLSTTQVENLKLKSDDAKIYIKLGDLSPLLKASIEGEDSRVRLRLPVNIGVRISGDDYGSYLKRLGLIETDSGFINKYYDSADVKADIELDERLGSFSLDYF
ncbi:MAG: hypothetical protein DRP35_01765 [Candidatus Zixiibacteriota bacterium]|nr:MAG: hypothetical protein DRP35_01765 [candidate division Zixibacteria bacterium]